MLMLKPIYFCRTRLSIFGSFILLSFIWLKNYKKIQLLLSKTVVKGVLIEKLMAKYMVLRSHDI
jgi:hypothetical protein